MERRQLQLREYKNRFPDGNIIGANIMLNGMEKPMALKLYVSGVAWFCNTGDFPNGEIRMFGIDTEDLLNSPVVGWSPRNKWPLMEGDSIVLRTTGEKEEVISIKEGDGSPYPIVTKNSQYKWSEIVMIKKQSSPEIQAILSNDHDQPKRT